MPAVLPYFRRRQARSNLGVLPLHAVCFRGQWEFLQLCAYPLHSEKLPIGQSLLILHGLFVAHCQVVHFGSLDDDGPVRL